MVRARVGKRWGSDGELVSREYVRASVGVVSLEMRGKREAVSREDGVALSSVRTGWFRASEKTGSLKGEKVGFWDAVTEGCGRLEGWWMARWWDETE